MDHLEASPGHNSTHHHSIDTARSGAAEPFAPAPHGTALSDCARRKPSEIPSQTQSVSAFLPGTVTMGTPFLWRITLRALPPSKDSIDVWWIENLTVSFSAGSTRGGFRKRSAVWLLLPASLRSELGYAHSRPFNKGFRSLCFPHSHSV